MHYIWNVMLLIQYECLTRQQLVVFSPSSVQPIQRQLCVVIGFLIAKNKNIFFNLEQHRDFVF